MMRLVDAVRQALGPLGGDAVEALLARRLRVRHPRGANAWARFMDETRRSVVQGGQAGLVLGPERRLDDYLDEPSPRGTPCIPPLLACP